MSRGESSIAGGQREMQAWLCRARQGRERILASLTEREIRMVLRRMICFEFVVHLGEAGRPVWRQWE